MRTDTRTTNENKVSLSLSQVVDIHCPRIRLAVGGRVFVRNRMKAELLKSINGLNGVQLLRLADRLEQDAFEIRQRAANLGFDEDRAWRDALKKFAPKQLRAFIKEIRTMIAELESPEGLAGVFCNPILRKVTFGFNADDRLSMTNHLKRVLREFDGIKPKQCKRKSTFNLPKNIWTNFSRN
jgi:hypothetical protein